MLLFCGASDWSDVGRKSGNLPRSPNTIYTPMRLAALDDVRIVKVASGPASAHCLAIADDGRVFSWGRNEKGQLGLGHIKDRKCPSVIKELADRVVVDVAAGRNHSLFVTG
jgi:alpha-tubulin suppressor-like RCC1 family protein